MESRAAIGGYRRPIPNAARDRNRPAPANANPFAVSCRPALPLLFGCFDSRLKGQLDSARGIIEGVARGAVLDDSKKRLRIGTVQSDREASSSSALDG